MNRHSKITRRNLIRAGCASGGLMAAGGSQALAQPNQGIEPLTIRRRGTGLRGFDPDRASRGFTLFSGEGNTAYLIDLRGEVVHTWQMPHPDGGAYLTEQGRLFYSGQIPNDSYVGRRPYMAGSALEMDWNGKMLGR